MGVPNVAFTWRSLKILRAIVSTMSIIGLTIVLAAIVWAIKLRRDIGEFLNLAVPGDGHLWPTVIIVAAVSCAPVYLLGLKAYLCVRLANPTKKFQENTNNSDDEENSEHSSEDSSDDEDEDDDEKSKGQDTNRILFFHAILCLLSGCLVTAINVACFLKSSTFQDKINEDGLMEVMENYSTDDVARSRMDAIQLEFQCCGSEDYRDWFRVSWFQQSMEYFDYVGDESQQQGFFYSERLAENNEDREIPVEDVPFSCCTNKIIEPCGPHEVLRASTVCNFDPSKEGTVWNVGCLSVIVTRAQVLGLVLILFLLFLTIYQFVLSVLSRFLQTAYSNKFYIGPEMDYYRSWIFNGISCSCTKCYTNTSQDSDEETLETRSPIKETSPSPTVCVNNKDNDRVDWKKHEFMLTPRGSVQLVQVDRLRKAKSNPVFYQNSTFNERVRKSKVKLDYYRELPTDEPYQERKQSDKKIFIDRSDKSMKASSRSRERLSNKKSDVPIAPVPPPFPPQSDEYAEERNLVSGEAVKIDESSSTKLRSAFVTNNESTEEKVKKEMTSKPSKEDRRKLLEKFEKVLGADQRRQSGGADFPRPWEQLVQRSINSTENTRVINDNRTSPRTNEKTHVLSKFRSADAYDRFRGTLQDTLSRRRENLKEPTNPIGRSPQPVPTCTCCMKHSRNFSRSSRCKVQRTAVNSYPIDPEDLGVVHRRNLLPDIPCPPPPPLHTNPYSSACYPRPTLIRQQQQEQRRQRQWNFRQGLLTNDQPPPWTLPASFSRPLTSNFNPEDDHRICCHGRTFCTTHEVHSTFERDDAIKKYCYRMD